VVEVTVVEFRQSREFGAQLELPILEGDRIQTEPAASCSEGTLKHYWDTTSTNTGGQRGG
jgi:hypothetical protein